MVAPSLQICRYSIREVIIRSQRLHNWSIPFVNRIHRCSRKERIDAIGETVVDYQCIPANVAVPFQKIKNRLEMFVMRDPQTPMDMQTENLQIFSLCIKSCVFRKVTHSDQ